MSIGSYAVTTNVIKQWNQTLLFKILDNIEDVIMVLDSDPLLFMPMNLTPRFWEYPSKRSWGAG